MVTEVSSTESCSRPAAMEIGSIFMSARTLRDFERMDEIGLAGGAGLAGVVLLGEFVGFLDEVEIVVGTVLAQLLHQLAEAGHREHVGRDLLTQRRHDGL